MKTPTKEEIEKASLRFDNPDAIYGFEEGANWALNQLEDISPPQSADVMTLEDTMKLEDIHLMESTFNRHVNCRAIDVQQVFIAMSEYGQAKSDQLQAELEQVKAERDAMREALQHINDQSKAFNMKHVAKYHLDMLNTSEEALQSTKQ